MQPDMRVLRTLLTAFTLGLCGCPRAATTTPTPTATWAGRTLRVATVPAGQRIAERGRAAWEGRTQAKIAFVSADADADAVLFPPYRLAALAAANRLDAVPEPFRRTESWLGFAPLPRNRLCQWEGRTLAYPLAGDALFLLFRRDFYAEAKLTPPTDWDEFERQAKLWRERRNEPSLPAWPVEDDGVDRQFFALAASRAIKPVTEDSLRKRAVTGRADVSPYSFQFDAETGRPRIDDPAFVAALEQLGRLQPLRGSGRPVLMVATLADLAAVRSERGKWDVRPLPGGVPYLGAGGFLGAAIHGASGVDLAHNFLQELCSVRKSQEIVHDPSLGAAPTRRSHLDQQVEGWYGYGLDADGTNELRKLLREQIEPPIVNPGLRLRVPSADEYEAVLLAAIRRAVNGSDARTELTGVQAAWEKLGDAESRRLAYRKSLNLQ